MSPPNIGNVLYRLVSSAQTALFDQGELTQLTYGAFDVVATNVTNAKESEIEISYPVGYRPDKTTILGIRKYNKEGLLGRYQLLAHQQMPINGLAQLVTITEALLSDIVRNIIIRYPQKLGAKRTIQLQAVLEAQSLEEVHLRATDSLLHDLSYKSPAEFSEALNNLLAINLMECPAFHKYIELKATRDIHVHNRGYVNETYLKKSASHARARANQFLPVDIPYFLESYEACLQLTEWLEQELNLHWYSSERESAINPQPLAPSPSLTTVEEVVAPVESKPTAAPTKQKTHGKKKPAAR
ncbi:MAG: hypothetical protein KJ852_02410 [Gammaproteobacteria bacterium]|nr:hypothetical protein [Gammaproteobacteria bacterium]MBU0787435.1 hypothetical protein [Gammaproteobacteria bacterium]MBU0815095.1 hypothetical protein [Gammaproteobacteria bacterium]MBU1785797.1 hypothetical protein [Gammaproteobacteria bacterium]